MNHGLPVFPAPKFCPEGKRAASCGRVLMDLLHREGERRKQRGCRFENLRLYIQLKFSNPSPIVKSQTTRCELKTSIGLRGLIEE